MQGFRPESEIPGRHPSSSRVNNIKKVLTVEIYTQYTLYKKIKIAELCTLR